MTHSKRRGGGGGAGVLLRCCDVYATRTRSNLTVCISRAETASFRVLLYGYTRISHRRGWWRMSWWWMSDCSAAPANKTWMGISIHQRRWNNFTLALHQSRRCFFGGALGLPCCCCCICVPVAYEYDKLTQSQQNWVREVMKTSPGKLLLSINIWTGMRWGLELELELARAQVRLWSDGNSWELVWGEVGGSDQRWGGVSGILWASEGKLQLFYYNNVSEREKGSMGENTTNERGRSKSIDCSWEEKMRISFILKWEGNEQRNAPSLVKLFIANTITCEKDQEEVLVLSCILGELSVMIDWGRSVFCFGGNLMQASVGS